MALMSLLKLELISKYRKSSELINALVFFLMIISLFPLAISPDPKQLQSIAPGILQISMLLSIMLTSLEIFKTDFAQGIIEHWHLSNTHTIVLIIIKLIAHFVLCIVPLLIITPVISIMLHIQAAHILILMLVMFISSISLTVIGALGAALTVSIRSGGILLALIVLPLYIPVLIFSSTCIEAAIMGFDFHVSLLLLLAMAIFNIAVIPFAIYGGLLLSEMD